MPAGYEQQFENEEEPHDPDLKFRVSLADAAAAQLVDVIYNEVGNILLPKAPTLDLSHRSRILDEYRLFVPAAQTESLTNILNAAWGVFNDAQFWPDVVEPPQKLRILRDLILKNIELLEIEERVA